MTRKRCRPPPLAALLGAAPCAARKFVGRQSGARTRPTKVRTPDEQRVLDFVAKLHGKGGKEFAEAHAELILEAWQAAEKYAERRNRLSGREVRPGRRSSPSLRR